jgi:hypothetical protein
MSNSKFDKDLEGKVIGIFTLTGKYKSMEPPTGHGYVAHEVKCTCGNVLYKKMSLLATMKRCKECHKSKGYQTKRFLEHVKFQSNECWEWVARCDDQGRPIFTLNRKPLKAARAAVQLFQDFKLLRKHNVDRTCNNSKCVNPQHHIILELTSKDGVRVFKHIIP